MSICRAHSLIRRAFRWSTGLLLGALLLATLPAQAALELPDGVAAVPTAGYLDVLVEEPGRPFAATDLIKPALQHRWQPVAGAVVSLPQVVDPVWVRLVVVNRAAHDDWVIWVGTPIMVDVQVHAYDRSAGRWLPARAPSLKDPSWSRALHAPPGHEVVVLVHATPARPVQLPVEIRYGAALQAERYDHAAWMGALLGILGAMLLYNASLYLFTAERSYGQYAGYLLSVLIYELAATGYGPLYLWGGVPWAVARGYATFGCFTFLAATLFVRHFLGLSAAGLPGLLRVNDALVAFWAAWTVSSALTSTAWLHAGIVAGALVSSGCALYTAAVLIRRGSAAARYFFVAWTAVIAGTSWTLLARAGLVPPSRYDEYAQHAGFIIETVLLSVALAARIREERRRREAAQQAALEAEHQLQDERDAKIRAQAEALEATLRANRELEERVGERTGQLQLTLHTLELANEELAHLSITDALTQLHNRGYFDRTLALELERAAATGSPLALLMVDIDHFKVVNDRWGHLAGDECLRQVAIALRNSACRAGDLVARYGGEEFGVVLAGTAAAPALDLAERARRAVEALAVHWRGEPVPLTISIGVAVREGAAAAAVDPSEFVRQADTALYAAKRAGRNRVCGGSG